MLKPLIALIAAVTAAGLAAAAASAAGAPSPSARPQPKVTTPAAPAVQPSGQSQEREQEAAEPAEDQGGVHGGPVARFHGDASQACNLTDVSKLTGNWTHGDYVTAVAAADPTRASQAAHSSCGKPAKAAGKGKAKGRH